mmetsp:Transcript_31589/g.100725  ORF Transcript_31589/g.100725 Transcript_31589/m.100725 type:complete len:213 (-) Transcript_31589:323-961(-)
MTVATGTPRERHSSMTKKSRLRSPASVSERCPRQKVRTASAPWQSTPASYSTRSGRCSSRSGGRCSRSKRRYSSSPVPLGSPTSTVERCLRTGKARAACIEKVAARGSSLKMAAVPSPWCTSRSTTSTRRAAPSASSARLATARSLKGLKPLPAARCAWCVPPPRLHAIPVERASRAASSVPATSSRTARTIAGLHGRPIRRIAFGASVPSQ